MTIYTCNKCSKIFIRKQELERHMNRKFPCNKEEIQSNNIIAPKSTELAPKSLQPDGWWRIVGTSANMSYATDFMGQGGEKRV